MKDNLIKQQDSRMAILKENGAMAAEILNSVTYWQFAFIIYHLLITLRVSLFGYKKMLPWRGNLY